MSRRHPMAGPAVALVAVAALWTLAPPAALTADASGGRLWAEPIDAQIVALSALAAWACTGWLLLGTAAALLARVPGQAGRAAARVAARITPTLVRRAVEAAVGAAIATSSVAAVSAPAAAAPVAAPAGGSVSEPRLPLSGVIGDRVVTGRSAHPRPLDAFDRPVAPQPADPDQATGSPAADAPPSRRAGRGAPPLDGEVVVLRGDTLWSIAAERLGPGADDAAIAAEWPRWYAANHERIGADPDLIKPGQRLVPPRTH
ncbi:MAG TPA: hypothetical protein VEZ46_09185 [Mycobacteriales bacterium]|nr:hypothetical protein [Mycobacteriales bacterium]